MISQSFTVAALPLDIIKADPSRNIANVKAYLPLLPGSTDLIVLPELFNTGYIDDPTEAAKYAEADDGYTMQAVAAMADSYNVAVCGSFLGRKGEKLYNRAFLVEPDGEISFYDKRHLFCISDEARIAEKGQSLPPVVRYRGYDISFAICYDIRFPAWIRASAANCDILVIPANWPQKRAYAWLHLLQARAIENQIYVVGCNRSGDTEYGKYDNESYIIDYMGKIMGTVHGEEPKRNVNLHGDAPIVAELSKKDLLHFREHFPAWRDADDFTIADL